MQIRLKYLAPLLAPAALAAPTAAASTAPMRELRLQSPTGGVVVRGVDLWTYRWP
jgi:hypothetical protein